MKRNINKAAIDKKSYNSTYVGVLSYHAIQVKEEGAYLGHIIYKDKVVESIKIDSRENCSEYQVNLDFNSVSGYSTSQRKAISVSIKPGGYLLLYNSMGDTPYRFQLEKAGKKPYDNIIRDTRELCPGDLYTCCILKPGTYRVLFNGKETNTICVEYPTSKTDKSRLNDAVRVAVGGKARKKGTVDLLPMQGLVFELEAPGYIEVIEVEIEKDRGLIYQQRTGDRKQKTVPSKKTYQWRNPKYTTTK